MITTELRYNRTSLKDFISVQKRSVMESSRQQKINHFYSLCNYNAPVLDVGVSGYDEYNPQVNFFLNNFRLPSYQYTGLAVEPVAGLKLKYPDKDFVEYPGDYFPFKENEFDWIFSNAVIEHVGGEEEQVLFINEMLRVGKNVFFTTPNKYFPVESHTDVFFRHWFPKSFYKWCSRNHSYYSQDNLKLLSYWDLHRLLKKSEAKSYNIYLNKLMSLTMTFSVVIR
jgi:hypothetical protein